MDPGSGGQASGCGTATPVVGRWTLEELNASEQAFPAVGTQTQAGGQQIEEPLTVVSVLGVRPGGRLRLAESVPAAGEKLGPGSVGQEAVVTDADKALGDDVEEEAADELMKMKGQRSDPMAAVILETEGDRPVVDPGEGTVNSLCGSGPLDPQGFGDRLLVHRLIEDEFDRAVGRQHLALLGTALDQDGCQHA